MFELNNRIGEVAELMAKENLVKRESEKKIKEKAESGIVVRAKREIEKIREEMRPKMQIEVRRS